MHILLTRPLEDCSEMILKFQSLDHQVSHLPLTRIEKVNYEEINFSEYENCVEKYWDNSCWNNNWDDF